MAFYTNIDSIERTVTFSMVWFDDTGSPPEVVPVATGSPPDFEWLPDNPPDATPYTTVTRIEPVPLGATEIEYDVQYISLADAKVKKKQEVNVLRDAKLNIAVAYDGHNYDADPTSRLNLTATVASINAGIPLPETGSPATFTWRTADNQNVAHDATSLKALASAMLNVANACYNDSWNHKEAIDAFTTVEDIVNYDIMTGWTI
jgi:hypothetical protein